MWAVGSVSVAFWEIDNEAFQLFVACICIPIGINSVLSVCPLSFNILACLSRISKHWTYTFRWHCDYWPFDIDLNSVTLDCTSLGYCASPTYLVYQFLNVIHYILLHTIFNIVSGANIDIQTEHCKSCCIFTNALFWDFLVFLFIHEGINWQFFGNLFQISIFQSVPGANFNFICCDFGDLIRHDWFLHEVLLRQVGYTYCVIET